MGSWGGAEGEHPALKQLDHFGHKRCTSDPGMMSLRGTVFAILALCDLLKGMWIMFFLESSWVWSWHGNTEGGQQVGSSPVCLWGSRTDATELASLERKCDCVVFLLCSRPLNQDTEQPPLRLRAGTFLSSLVEAY